MAFLIGGANSAADTGYNVDNSCRFNSADSAELTKTPGGAGNLDAWTLSFWFKDQIYLVLVQLHIKHYMEFMQMLIIKKY